MYELLYKILFVCHVLSLVNQMYAIIFLLILESSEVKKSVWINGEERPELWTSQWRQFYAQGEPDFSGECFYLSASRYFFAVFTFWAHFFKTSFRVLSILIVSKRQYAQKRGLFCDVIACNISFI